MADFNAVALLGVALTAAGLAFGLYQYRINSEQAELSRRRERAVTATKQTREFLADPNVRFVMDLMDYGEAAFVDGDSKKSFSTTELKSALTVNWIGKQPGEVKDLIAPEYRAIRASFDGF